MKTVFMKIPCLVLVPVLEAVDKDDHIALQLYHLAPVDFIKHKSEF